MLHFYYHFFRPAEDHQNLTMNCQVQDGASDCGGWLQHCRPCGRLRDWEEICPQENPLPFHRGPKYRFAGRFGVFVSAMWLDTHILKFKPTFPPICTFLANEMVSQEVRVTRELSHTNIVKVVGASTRGQADILHNLTSEVLIVFPLYQVVVHNLLNHHCCYHENAEEPPRRVRIP